MDSLFFFFFVRAGQWASVILLVRIEQSIVMVRSGSIKSKVDSSHGVSEVVCKGGCWNAWIFLGRFFYAHSPRQLLKILDAQSQCYFRDVFFGDSTFLRRYNNEPGPSQFLELTHFHLCIAPADIPVVKQQQFLIATTIDLIDRTLRRTRSAPMILQHPCYPSRCRLQGSHQSSFYPLLPLIFLSQSS